MAKIIKIQGPYKLPEAISHSDNSERFDYIYRSGLWLDGSEGESRSGGGSAKKATTLYKDQLNQYLDLIDKSNDGNKLNFFDAPCGDLNWVKDFCDKIRYSGGDISESLISDLHQQFPNIETFVFDITKDEFPNADMWHCRHCLFHLSLEDIYKSLENFCRSKIEIALITNHFLPNSVTFDIDTGNFRFIDLTNFPFNLPDPKLWLLDEDPRSGKTAMATGVWTREQIKLGVENYKSLLQKTDLKN